MKHICFNKRFVNATGNDLISGKIHTIRQNYDYWKKFESREVALFTWEGKPYRSKQKVFCVKTIVSVQEVLFITDNNIPWFLINGMQLNSHITMNDGFIDSDGIIDTKAFFDWFANYKSGKMAVLHFTDFRY